MNQLSRKAQWWLALVLVSVAGALLVPSQQIDSARVRPAAGISLAHQPSTTPQQNVLTSLSALPSAAVEVGAPQFSLPTASLADDLQRLAPATRERVLAGIASVPELLRDCDSLRVTPAGDLIYACRWPNAVSRGSSQPKFAAASVDGQVGMSSAAVWQPSDGVDAVPVRHSLPGAPNVIYIHFSGGYTVENSSWNDPPDVKDRFTTQPFDRDGVPARFSEDERASMVEIWARVAEDFQPFNVDVTTERPAEMHGRVALVVFTGAIDTDGDRIPYAVQLGPALFAGFNQPNFRYHSPATLIYANEFQERQTFDEVIANVASHELGHYFGLYHDGLAGQEYHEYYGGHGVRFPREADDTWAPIMGSSGDNLSVQWSKGDYTRASNREDDIAIIGGQLGFRADDVGDSLAAARTLAVSTAATTRFDGILNRDSDVDLFAFDAPAGLLTVRGDPFTSTRNTRLGGGNVDVKLELLDASGAVVQTHDPISSKGALIERTVAAGRFHVRISPVGWGNPLADPPTGYTNYGSIGQYFLAVSAATAAPPPPTAPPSTSPPTTPPPSTPNPSVNPPAAAGGGGGGGAPTAWAGVALALALLARGVRRAR